MSRVHDNEWWNGAAENGYAIETMTTLINDCFNTMKLKRLIAFANLENIASNKVIL